ncbi:response regulator transcription factor [Caenispirillum bisanense]|uniref:response regulator transcription factor n=1 Tax=Caenispirillum bisanense TaxID=414052 RepID=UPI0031DA1B81
MTAGRRLLLVDDDDLLRRSLVEQLTAQEDFAAIVEAPTAAEARRIAATDGPFDVVLLDVGLPDADGRDVCRALRAEGIRCPILMLTAADSDDDTITGLEAGANDYITKPFRLAVLLARLRAHIRSHEASDDAVFQIGPYKFHPATKMLTDEGRSRRIRLTEKETAILKYLYRAGGAVGREQLLDEVWGYNAGVTTHTLETHVYRLRQKIEPKPGQVTLLLTAEGGYRLELAGGAA